MDPGEDVFAEGFRWNWAAHIEKDGWLPCGLPDMDSFQLNPPCLLFSLTSVLHSWLKNFQSSLLHPFSSSISVVNPESTLLCAQSYRWGEIQSWLQGSQQEGDRPADPPVWRELPRVEGGGIMGALGAQEGLSNSTGHQGALARGGSNRRLHSHWTLKLSRSLPAGGEGNWGRQPSRQRELQVERHRGMEEYRVQGWQSFYMAREEAHG